MLQRKAGVHRQQDAENSEQKVTNLHIVMRHCGIAHARVPAFPGSPSRPRGKGLLCSDPAWHSVNTMSKLVLCALLTMAPLAQAASVMDRYDAGGSVSKRYDAIHPRTEEFLPQVGRGAVSERQNVETIAQVAAETAQLLPSNRLGASPSPKAPKVLRGARPGRAMTRPSKTKVVNADHFKPSALWSKYKNDAEQFAKANGCSAPVATMKFAVVGPENFETFAVTCGAVVSMSIRCDSGRCRAM
jgi:hypothetical protein